MPYSMPADLPGACNIHTNFIATMAIIQRENGAIELRDHTQKLRFEAIAAMLPEKQEVAKAGLDAIIVKPGHRRTRARRQTSS